VIEGLSDLRARVQMQVGSSPVREDDHEAMTPDRFQAIGE
jgi:hypothetical protein